MRSRSLTLAAAIALVVGSAASAACSSFSGDTAPDDVDDVNDGNALLDPDVGTADRATPDAPPGADGDTVLASGRVDLAGVLATESQVYFVERSSGAVYALPIDGGMPVKIAEAPELPKPSGLAVADDDVYWIDDAARKLAHRDADGGVNVTAIDVTENLLVARSIVATPGAAASKLIVAASDSDDLHGSVLQYGSVGASPKHLQDAVATLFDVAVMGTQIAWTAKATGSIWNGQLGSDAAAELVVGELACESIAVDAQGIYWARPGTGMIRTTIATVGAPVTSLAVGEANPFSLAADASGVYWLTEEGKLRRSTRTELPLETISSGFASTFPDRRVQAIALTSKYVVWITSDGHVMRHDK